MGVACLPPPPSHHGVLYMFRSISNVIIPCTIKQVWLNIRKRQEKFRYTLGLYGLTLKFPFQTI